MSRSVYKAIFLSLLLALIGSLFVSVGGNGNLASYSMWSRPEFWPRVVLIGMAVTIVLKLYWPKNGETKKERVKDTIAKLVGARIVLGIVIVTAYCFSTQYLGFAFSTMIFLGLFMWYLGQRSIKSLIAMPAVSVLLILFVFWRMLYVSLPKGVGVFLEFSNLILAIVRMGASG